MGSRLRRTALVVPAALAGLALLLSACGGAGVTTLSSPPTTDASLTLTLQHSPVGPILATGGGDTLYDFVPDTPTHSACLNDGCVFQWPPLVKSAGRSGSARASTTPWSARCGAPTARPSSPTAATRSTPTTATSRPGVVMGQAIDQDGGLWYVLDAQGQAESRTSVHGPGSPQPKRLQSRRVARRRRAG